MLNDGEYDHVCLRLMELSLVTQHSNPCLLFVTGKLLSYGGLHLVLGLGFLFVNQLPKPQGIWYERFLFGCELVWSCLLKVQLSLTKPKKFLQADLGTSVYTHPIQRKYQTPGPYILHPTRNFLFSLIFKYLFNYFLKSLIFPFTRAKCWPWQLRNWVSATCLSLPILYREFQQFIQNIVWIKKKTRRSNILASKKLVSHEQWLHYCCDWPRAQ